MNPCLKVALASTLATLPACHVMDFSGLALGDGGQLPRSALAITGLQVSCPAPDQEAGADRIKVGYVVTCTDPGHGVTSLTAQVDDAGDYPIAAAGLEVQGTGTFRGEVEIPACTAGAFTLAVALYDDTFTTAYAQGTFFRPYLGAFRATGSLPAPAGRGAMAQFWNGDVLVAGGTSNGLLAAGGGQAVAGAWLYQAGSGAFIPVQEGPGAALARADAVAVRTGGDLVLICGGVALDGTPLANSVLCDGHLRTLAPTGSMGTARTGHAALRLWNGNVLVAGGRDASGAWLASAEVYEVDRGAWTPVGSMAVARADFQLLQAGTLVLAAGGTTGPDGAPTASAEAYDPNKAAFSPLPDLGQARASYQGAATLDGQAVLAGGLGAQGALATAERFAPAVRAWSPTGPLGAQRRRGAAVTLADGRILLAGGLDGAGAPLATAEVFVPSSGAWFPTGTMTGPRVLDGRACLLRTGAVLFAGTGDAACELYR